MGLRIRTNVQSLTAQRHMGLSGQAVAKQSEKQMQVAEQEMRASCVVTSQKS